MNPILARAKIRRIMRESDERQPLRRLADRINPAFVLGLVIGALAIGLLLSRAVAIETPMMCLPKSGVVA